MKLDEDERKLDRIRDGQGKLKDTLTVNANLCTFVLQVNHFMENENTRNFISACLYSRNSGNINVKIVSTF